MHELSIALSLLDLARDEAARRGEAGLVAIHVRLGPLSGVVKESLLSAYDLAREQTDLADCRLEIEEMPIVIYCEHCGGERQPESPHLLLCARCGAPAARVVSGDELELTALEVEA
jgi:hydrogenase nickel incorporation protein HypA/HybF